MRRFMGFALVIVMAVAVASSGFAAYPDRPVKLIGSSRTSSSCASSAPTRSTT